jgi:DNA-directed RNA polymerase specialized sigma24 family protein
VDGYSQREIAAMLGVAEGTVSSWLSRGKAALRDELGDRRTADEHA